MFTPFNRTDISYNVISKTFWQKKKNPRTYVIYLLFTHVYIYKYVRPQLFNSLNSVTNG